ncbi:MAG: hypothetical protein LW724_05140 [Planctomycetaceae bacterium]|nr:hypothetical protein [Planctomycetaceae bacterium]
MHNALNSLGIGANGNSETFGTKGRLKRPWKNRPKKTNEEIDKKQQYYGSQKHSKPRANTDSPGPGRHGTVKHSLLPSL